MVGVPSLLSFHDHVFQTATLPYRLDAQFVILEGVQATATPLIDRLCFVHFRHQIAVRAPSTISTIPTMAVTRAMPMPFVFLSRALAFEPIELKRAS